MAAASDKFMEVGEPGTATTLGGAGYSIGGTSITVGSTTGWPSTTGVIFAIDRAEIVNGEEVQVAGTYCEFEGTVDTGTTITNVDYKRGDGDQNFAAGALTRVYIPVSSERENRLVQGLAVEHSQDGTHSDITADSIVIADAGTLEVDTINEATTANGVTIDGVLLKDSQIATADAVITNSIAAQAVTGEKIDNSSIIYATTTPGGNSDTTAAWADWGASTTVTVPTWANRALVTASIGGYFAVTAATRAQSRVVIGSDNGTGSGQFGSADTSGAEAMNHTWQDYITLTGTGSVTLKNQVIELGGSGALRVNTASRFSWVIVFQKV